MDMIKKGVGCGVGCGVWGQCLRACLWQKPSTRHRRHCIGRKPCAPTILGGFSNIFEWDIWRNPPFFYFPFVALIELVAATAAEAIVGFDTGTAVITKAPGSPRRRRGR